MSRKPMNLPHLNPWSLDPNRWRDRIRHTRRELIARLQLTQAELEAIAGERDDLIRRHTCRYGHAYTTAAGADPSPDTPCMRCGRPHGAVDRPDGGWTMTRVWDTTRPAGEEAA